MSKNTVVKNEGREWMWCSDCNRKNDPSVRLCFDCALRYDPLLDKRHKKIPEKENK